MIKPVVLIVLDGWGISPKGPGNAISIANTPVMDKLLNAYPHTQIQASGEAVGLPRGEDGNSEVGHLNLGSGRVVYQDLARIDLSIADGSFFRNAAFINACKHVKENNAKLVLMGLVGSGVVHSCIEHIYALLRLAKELSLDKEKVVLHLFTDGRDSPPTSGSNFISEINQKLTDMEIGVIATVSGRYFAMDRDKNWARTQKAYKAIAEGRGIKATSPVEAIEQSYANSVTDEFIEPIVIIDENQTPKGMVEDNDAIIFFNFRPDRARQLTKAFIAPAFRPFEREKFINNLFFVSMAEYEKGLPVSAIAFTSENVKNPLAMVLSRANLRQLHIAETEKYAHVTYFFNGGREDPFPGEDRILIPSPHVATFDELPEMSAQQISEVVFQKIIQRIYDFIIVNFANPDMVAHTGNISATIKAVEVTDKCLGKIARTVIDIGGVCLVTSDHGNAEELLNPNTHGMDTEHSANPVPLVIASTAIDGTRRHVQGGILGDVAPTILEIMGIRKPIEMTGKNLLL